MIPYPGTILRPAPPDQHHAVLLHIVPLSGYVRRDHAPGAQPYPARLAFPGVGLLGLGNADLQADALHRGVVDERRGGLLAERLRLAAFSDDLHECCAWAGGAGECAVVGEEGFDGRRAAGDGGGGGGDCWAEEACEKCELHLGRVVDGWYNVALDGLLVQYLEVVAWS